MARYVISPYLTNYWVLHVVAEVGLTMNFPIDKVFELLFEVSGLEDVIRRDERIIYLKQQLGLTDLESLNAFKDVYAYALVEYAFDDDGRRKPRELISLFKTKEVRNLFESAYRDNNPKLWLEKGQAIAQYKLDGKLPGINPKQELGIFAAVFLNVLKRTQSPKEVRLETKVSNLQQQMLRQSEMQQLTLEAINQKVSQLAGVEELALPQAAQKSDAANLAHQLGRWFDVLEYKRLPDHEVWKKDYFEWMIEFPIGRRRVSRTLVRGVAGVVETSDVQSLQLSITETEADEGWLIGNRRVSKAARGLVKEDDAYGNILCYTFDELIDEDADFSRYLDWLASEIKTRGVDINYLPLACRKDDLDPVTQRKVGVSIYGEDDGWIDGYVEMWLDDPAKEHLSILGEFGTGKTWFALHYAWVALQKYQDARNRGVKRPRIPVVIPLRDYSKSVSVESLFSEFFFRKHRILPNYAVLERLNEMGKLLLIFDGFDEMAARIDRQAMIDNFWELAKVVVPGAKTILTCRTEHFPDAIEGQKILNAELKASVANKTGEPPQFEVLELEKFNDVQIRQLLEQKATSETVERVLANPQLLDLARRPVMVDLILKALPDIESGKPVDMARVYLYATTNQMQMNITSERTFTSLADKLYFLCELSWKMLSTNQMTLNYRSFPDELQKMFANRMADEKSLDHWRYDMMAQTMLIRNAEGDYSPAHRSLLEFFVAYKIVASLGSMAEDFTEVARKQSHVDSKQPSRNYTWDDYFKTECDEQGNPLKIAQLNRFDTQSMESLLPLLSGTKLTQAIIDLACPMLDESVMQENLLALLQSTNEHTAKEINYLGGNVVQLMLAKTPHALVGSDLSGTKLQGVDFSNAFLRRVRLRNAVLDETQFSKVLGSVNSVTYAPDKNHLAIGDHKGVWQIWNLDASQVICFVVGHRSAINSITYRPDGLRIATGSDDQTVKIWNAETGDWICTLADYTGRLLSVAYSPDGLFIATGSDNQTVKIWNPDVGCCMRTLEGHTSNVLSVAYSPDGKQLATGSDDKTVKIWNPMTGECIATLRGHDHGVLSVAYSPDKNYLATADKVVRIWNLQEGRCVLTLPGHEYGVTSVVYDLDGKHLVTSSYDKTAKVWSVITGECISTLRDHRNGVLSVSYSPDGKQLATGSYDRTVKIWDVSSEACTHTLESYENWFRSIVYSPDGEQLATGSDDGIVKVWNVATGRCTNVLKGHQKWVRSVAYSPDGKQLVTGSDDGTARIWNISSERCLHILEDHDNWVLSVAYSPDGKQSATGSYDKTVKLWSVNTGECINTLEGHENWVRSVAYSPDGKQLVTGSDDGTVRIWDVRTGECINALEGHENWVRSVAYSPNGKQLATGSYDKTAKVWSSETGNCIGTLEGHENGIRSVAYSPDGKQLATGSYDKTVRIWAMDTGKCLRILEGYNTGVRSVAYSPSGQQLATVSDDDIIRVWNVSTGRCIRIIDERTCAGLDITGTVGLTVGQRSALKLMGAVDDIAE